jgi:hypothetical protein
MSGLRQIERRFCERPVIAHSTFRDGHGEGNGGENDASTEPRISHVVVFRGRSHHNSASGVWSAALFTV